MIAVSGPSHWARKHLHCRGIVAIIGLQVMLAQKVVRDIVPVAMNTSGFWGKLSKEDRNVGHIQIITVIRAGW